MKRNRRNKAKKERVIMIASSAFVLTALTLTGIYMKSNEAESQDDGYSLDYAQMENSAGDKFEEIAKNLEEKNEFQDQLAVNDGAGGIGVQTGPAAEMENIDDALDFMPIEIEIGSNDIIIPGVNDGEALQQAPEVAQAQIPAEESEKNEAKATAGNNVEAAPTLHFEESDGLLRPVNGEVMLPFSMDGSIYFSTLDQYKYNPALMIAAAEGDLVLAAAEGKVIDIFENEEIGHAVTMELGDGYRMTYGQLSNITVSVGDYVEEGESFASVAAPTKYFSVEGTNLYLKMTVDGSPIDPELLFR